MKKVIQLILIAFMAMYLGACALDSPLNTDEGTKVTKQDGTVVEYAPGEYVDTQVQENIMSCWEWAENEQDKKWEQIGEMPASHKSFVLMQEDVLDTIKTLLGKDANPCEQGTNKYDAYAAYVKGEVERQDNLGKNIVGGAKVVVYPVAAVRLAGEVLGAAGDRVGGDKINAEGPVLKSGNDQAVDGLSSYNEDTETHSTLSQSNISGRDSKMEPATNSINQAPPVPEVEEPEIEEPAVEEVIE